MKTSWKFYWDVTATRKQGILQEHMIQMSHSYTNQDKAAVAYKLRNTSYIPLWINFKNSITDVSKKGCHVIFHVYCQPKGCIFQIHRSILLQNWFCTRKLIHLTQNTIIVQCVCVICIIFLVKINSFDADGHTYRLTII